MKTAATFSLTALALVSFLAGCEADPVGPQCNEVPFEQVSTSGDTVTTATGLRFIPTQEGSGATATSCRQVVIEYTGSLSTGEQFDSGSFAFTPGFGEVVPGFEQGVIGLEVGGARRLILPPALGYGAEAVRNRQTGEVIIPANSTLIFDVELVDVAGS